MSTQPWGTPVCRRGGDVNGLWFSNQSIKNDGVECEVRSRLWVQLRTAAAGLDFSWSTHTKICVSVSEMYVKLPGADQSSSKPISKKLKHPRQTFNRNRKGDWKLFFLRYFVQRGTKIRGKKKKKSSKSTIFVKYKKTARFTIIPSGFQKSREGQK